MSAGAIFKTIPLQLPVDLKGEACTAIHVHKPTVRQIREWSEDPQAPSPMVRTPGGLFLADADMDDLLAEDADVIAAAVLDFLPPRLRAAPDAIPATPSLSSPLSAPKSEGSEISATSDGTSSANSSNTPEPSPANESAAPRSKSPRS